ncbi:hypothetical protein Scep_004115 [Stephania cephalantha]|uniref:Uncharacterized protein n=1 Tax=Stephania cephalantha TaxID=152367 RepID=A0AAP0PYR1_9MAGN
MGRRWLKTKNGNRNNLKQKESYFKALWPFLQSPYVYCNGPNFNYVVITDYFQTWTTAQIHVDAADRSGHA